MTKGLFVTATGTDVGKTYITALLVKKLRQAGYQAGYYKAALSGAVPENGDLVPGDAAYVCQTAGMAEKPADVVSYIYEHAVSPHLAARLEGNPPELSRIVAHYQQLSQRYDYLTVEGSGGVVCPLRCDDKQLMLLDVMQALQLPALVVSEARLGSINAAVLTVFYLQQHQIPVKGIILNRFQADDGMEQDNRVMIERLTGVPVLAVVKAGDTELASTAEELLALYETGQENSTEKKVVG